MKCLSFLAISNQNTDHENLKYPTVILRTKEILRDEFSTEVIIKGYIYTCVCIIKDASYTVQYSLYENLYSRSVERYAGEQEGWSGNCSPPHPPPQRRI